MRLLPWVGESGTPCYLSSDDPGGRMSRLADEVETDLLDSAQYVLREARALLAETGLGTRELRFTGVRLAESLQDALRIAESRGYRLAPALLTPAEAEETTACAAGPLAGTSEA
ncbi:hypothetical protein ACIQZN_12440 [Streptomyces sp. NPDC097595]|uniref:hypothetical protein n=1 Tax=Streptomyces sp. NPDC097595 TaxID=3366090 RepID=UPI0038211532